MHFSSPCAQPYSDAQFRVTNLSRWRVQMKSRLLFLFLLLPLLAGAQTYTYSTIVYFGPASEGGPFFPIAQPLMDKQGNFYGTSEGGGTFNLGTVYKVAPDAAVTVLHSFNGPDRQDPLSNLA